MNPLKTQTNFLYTETFAKVCPGRHQLAAIAVISYTVQDVGICGVKCCIALLISSVYMPIHNLEI